MRPMWLVICALFISFPTHASAQSANPLVPAPKPITAETLKQLAPFEGQLVQLAAIVRHTDTAQAFTIGAKGDADVHVVVPQPANDAAHVGDTVTIVGFVRRFSAGEFERDYAWFRKADYADVGGGDWVIVATSVRTPEGTELVPANTISTSPPR